MWLLRRMIKLQLEPKIVCDYYIKEISVSIWNSGLTTSQVNDLDKIQKVTLKIILGDGFRFIFVNIKPISERRTELCTNFAVKLFKSDRSDQFFTRPNKQVNTRYEDPVLEAKCNTVRCYNAPHNYLSRQVNQNKDRLK